MEREQLNFYLQQLPFTEMVGLRKKIEESATVELIQKPTPQTLLVPVHDPINHGSFIGGEVLVTTSIVRVDGENGWGMAMDDNPEQAMTIAIFDAAFAADIFKEEVHRLAKKGEQIQSDENSKFNAKINSTRVAFDLL